MAPLRGVFDAQKQLLRRPEPWRRLERREHCLFGLVELPGGEIRPREIVQRTSSVDRMHRHDRAELAHGAAKVLLLQPQPPEPPMELVAHPLDLFNNFHTTRP